MDFESIKYYYPGDQSIDFGGLARFNLQSSLNRLNTESGKVFRQKAKLIINEGVVTAAPPNGEISIAIGGKEAEFISEVGARWQPRWDSHRLQQTIWFTAVFTLNYTSLYKHKDYTKHHAAWKSLIFSTGSKTD